MSRYVSHNHYHTEADAARRFIWFLLLMLGIALMVALYYVKTRAQSARAQADALAYQIRHERAAIAVLQAEIAHLESPDRVQTLAEAQLGLEPITTEQMIKPSDITEVFPLRQPAKTDVGGTP